MYLRYIPILMYLTYIHTYTYVPYIHTNVAYIHTLHRYRLYIHIYLLTLDNIQIIFREVQFFLQDTGDLFIRILKSLRKFNCTYINF